MEKPAHFCLSVVTAALVVALVTGLFRKNDACAVLIKTMAGLFLAFTVLRPVVTLDVMQLGLYLDTFSEAGADASQAGENLAQDAYRSYIKSETQAYILDKARDYGAVLEVEVQLNEQAVPCSAELTGTISPYAKTALAYEMEAELGILKENQRWIG